jgi:hypothetical protein
VRSLARDGEVSYRLNAIIQETCHELANSLTAQPEAIVLTGSFARSEGSVLLLGDQVKVLGDIEFMVFFRSGADLPQQQLALNQHAQTLRSQLAEKKVECELEFSAVTPEYLRTLRPQIFGYELLSHGKTVWGKEEVLAKAPRFPATKIPRFDAWRMLNNRLLEQLQWADVIGQGDRAQLLQVFYQLLKCQIDIGTTLLLFAGMYENTYAARASALRHWATKLIGEDGLWFIPLIANRVADCTAFKLSPDLTNRPLGVHLDTEDIEILREDVRRVLTDFVPLARSVWCWEAAQLAGLPMDKPREISELAAAVFQTQGWNEKLRGWAKLAAIPEVRQQRGFYRRAGSFLHRASPRYLIYSVASELYFSLPAVFSGSDPDVAQLEGQLPVVFTEHLSEPRAWWRLRANVITGWRLFLRNHWA